MHFCIDRMADTTHEFAIVSIFDLDLTSDFILPRLSLPPCDKSANHHGGQRQRRK
jgi:hypothetical protein